MRADVRDRGLASQGKKRIDWARRSMPVLGSIEERFGRERPLEGIGISACLHVTTETAVLMQTLQAGGARVRLCASNPLSTQDDVAASLVEHDGIEVFAIHGVDRDGYYEHIGETLSLGPDITMDDGADLVQQLHSERRDLLAGVRGGTEETTTGVTRLQSMATEGVLEYPVIAINDANTKHLFDNRYGTGQSTIDGILRATNQLLAGSVFVVVGYGWCGRGVAMRAAGMGARVMVTEVDPFRALEAVMDGYQVCPMDQAAAEGDFFCTVTGNLGVIQARHFAAMKEGAIVCNAGHFNVELDLKALAQMSRHREPIRESLEAFELEDGKRLYVLGEGRLINLAAAEGHPSMVMDMSFANQALSVEHLLRSEGLEPRVYKVPEAIDRQVAQSKLDAMGVAIDAMNAAQQRYSNSWDQGT